MAHHPGDEPGDGVAAIGKAGLRLALLLAVGGGVLMVLEPRDSPAFVISALTLAIGVLLVAVVLVLTWFAHRRHD